MAYCGCCGGGYSGQKAAYMPTPEISSRSSYGSHSGSHGLSGSYGLSKIVQNSNNYHSQHNQSPVHDYSANISNLETRVVSEAWHEPIQYSFQKMAGKIGYDSGSAYSSASFARTQVLYHSPDAFLNPDRPRAQFIGDAEQIKDYMNETFRLLLGKDLPDNLAIHLCSKDEMKRIHVSHSGDRNRWSDGIMGFAINHWPYGTEIFVRQGELDRVMVVLGHEIGHSLSEPLKDKHAEEAKAFAFELAWLKTIKEHNIAGLGESIRLEQPAANGLHDKALEIVQNLVRKGSEALDVFWEIAEKNITTGKISLSFA
jgi:hypothetical protein